MTTVSLEQHNSVLDPERRDILNCFRARCSVIYIPSPEEQRVIDWIFAHRDEIERSGAARSRRVKVWTLTGGLRSYHGDLGAGPATYAVEVQLTLQDGSTRTWSGQVRASNEPQARERAYAQAMADLRLNRDAVLSYSVLGVRETSDVPAGVSDPLAALDQVYNETLNLIRLEDLQPPGTIYIFCDLHAFFDDRTVVRRLRDIAQLLRGTTSTLVLLSPHLVLPRDLEQDVIIVDFPLPTREEIANVIYDEIVASLEEEPQGRFRLETSGELREAVARAASGLTFYEAEDAIAKAVAECGGIHPGIVPVINREKRRLIRRVSGLEFVSTDDTSLDRLGGMDVFKEDILMRGRGFREEARTRGIRPPKGYTLLGLPGTGKSLACKVIANTLGLPLLRLDLGAVKEGIVGQSEANLRAALAVAKACAPCVLQVDEVEKAFAGASSTWVGDSGVAKGLLGYFLTWMAEQEGVFVCFTANDLSTVPAPLLRKGRIDEIFFFNFPTLEERVEILAIHLRKRGYDPDRYDLKALAHETAGYVGSELEHIVDEALYLADLDHARKGGEFVLGDYHLREAASRTVPLWDTMAEQLIPLIKFVRSRRAREASSRKDDQVEMMINRMIDRVENEKGFRFGNDSWYGYSR